MSYATVSNNIFCLQSLQWNLLSLPSHNSTYRTWLWAFQGCACGSGTVSLVMDTLPSQQWGQRNRWQTRSEPSDSLGFQHLAALAFAVYHHCYHPHREVRNTKQLARADTQTLCQDNTLDTDQQLTGHNKRDHCDAQLSDIALRLGELPMDHT